jgi:hypothetical protein
VAYKVGDGDWNWACCSGGVAAGGGLVFLVVLPIRFLDMLISCVGWNNSFFYIYVDGRMDGCRMCLPSYYGVPGVLFMSYFFFKYTLLTYPYGVLDM